VLRSHCSVPFASGSNTSPPSDVHLTTRCFVCARNPASLQLPVDRASTLLRQPAQLQHDPPHTGHRPGGSLSSGVRLQMGCSRQQSWHRAMAIISVVGLLMVRFLLHRSGGGLGVISVTPVTLSQLSHLSHLSHPPVTPVTDVTLVTPVTTVTLLFRSGRVW
jgi:hypothetical protein